MVTGRLSGTRCRGSEDLRGPAAFPDRRAQHGESALRMLVIQVLDADVVVEQIAAARQRRDSAAILVEPMVVTLRGIGGRRRTCGSPVDAFGRDDDDVDGAKRSCRIRDEECGAARRSSECLTYTLGNVSPRMHESKRARRQSPSGPSNASSTYINYCYSELTCSSARLQPRRR